VTGGGDVMSPPFYLWRQVVKIKDVVSDYIMSDLPFTEDLIHSMFPEWRPQNNLMCPYHDDSNASLSIDVTGKAYCFGCKFRATNVIELFAHVYGVSYMEARKVIYNKLVKAVPETKVDEAVRTLWDEPDKRNWLYDVRNLTPDTVSKYKLGYSKYNKRYSIPIFDRFGTCVNIRWYGNKSKYKIINEKGHGAFRIYPESVLASDTDHVLLVEGEFDALVGLDNGIPTVTGTGGAGTWDDKYNWMFKDKHVFVLYDNDDAGRSGAIDVMQSLKGIAFSVTLLSPLDEEGKDLSDWHRHAPKLKTRLMLLKESLTIPVMVCDCCNKRVKSLNRAQSPNYKHEWRVCSMCKKKLKTMDWRIA
jgi:hypothetical protein